MRAIKSILRGILGLQAAAMLLIGAVGLLGAAKLQNRTAISPVTAAHSQSASLATIAIAAAFLALGALFATAWWTTRKPSGSFSVWAVAASALNVGQGVFIAWFSHIAAASRIHFSPADGAWFIVLGLAGLFVFSRREAAPTIASPKAASLVGDRTSAGTRHAVTALSTITQIAALVFWSRWAFTQHLIRRHGLAWIVLITAASVLSTLIHECGHAILAWCFEMKLLSFKAGPLQWRTREGKWAFKFNAAGLLTPGGCISAKPTRPDQAPWEFILMIAAGPGANLLFGTAAIWAVLHDRWGSYQQTWEFFAYTGAFCLIGAVLNLVPFRSEEGGYSDGARILQIATHSPLAANVIAPAPPLSAIDSEVAATPAAGPSPPPMPVRLVPQLSTVSASAPQTGAAKPTLRAVLTPEAADIANPSQAAVAAAPEPAVANVAPSASTLASPDKQSGSPKASPVVPVPEFANALHTGKAAHVASEAKPAPTATPPALTASQSTLVKEKPAPTLDEQLAARMESFLARPTARPAAKAKPPQSAPPIPETRVQAAIAAAKQDPSPATRNALDIAPPDAEKPVDPFDRIFSKPSPAAVPTPVATPAQTPPALAAAQELITPLPADASASSLESPLPVPASAPDFAETGLIASSTRIPESALSTATKPPAIRLNSTPAVAPLPAPGAKAPAVPSAFARRPRPEPLTSPAPGIDEILAAAAIPVEDQDTSPSATEIVASPVDGGITALPPRPDVPAAPPLESAPVGLVFSEAWPPRPAASQSTVARKDIHPASPASNTVAGAASTIEDSVPVDKPFPPQSEKPRYDPFDFLRAAAIESLNVNTR